MRGLSVVILDSQEVFAVGMVSLLARNRLHAHAAADLADVVAVLAADTGVRLAVLDVDAPGAADPGAIAELRRRFPALRIMLVTAKLDRAEILRCLRPGVHGVLCRAEPAREVVAAVRAVMAGGIFVPPAVSELHAPPEPEAPLPDLAAADNENHVPVIGAPAAAWEGARLSARQQAVLRLLRLGLSNKAIARELGLAEGTVKVHLAALYRTLRVRNRAGAVATAAGTAARRA